MFASAIQPSLSNRFRREHFLLSLFVGACSLALSAAAASPAQTQIDLLLRVAYPENGPGAAVLVRQGDRILVRQGYGLADLRHRVPLAPDRVFRIGSITKEFTAAAVLQLVAAGKLHLDDEVARYVPSFPTHGHRITIAQLLSHTSGIPNYTAEPRFRTIPTVPLTRQDIFDLIKDRPLNFEPGTDWAYCNTGYVLLGAVIEKVSGQSYAAYLRDHILAPAGLSHTAFGEQENLLAARAAGYSRTATGHWVGAVDLSVTQADAAGALVSDVDDLWRWEAALEEGRIVRPDLLALARTPVSLSKGEDRPGYGLGWELPTIAGHRAAGHGGTISGYRSYEISVPDLGLFVAILCNCDRPLADPQDVALQIVSLAADAPRMDGGALLTRN
jgi:CubicO group peptidase (beta-lactamase class C family)